MTTKKELICQCKRLGIKGYYNLKKDEIEKLIENNTEKNNVKKNSEIFLQEKNKEIFVREKKIEFMKNKVSEHFDPILFDEFVDWNDNELKNAIYLGGYYYKASTLLNHCETKKKSKNIIKDPINNDILTDDEILHIYNVNKKKYDSNIFVFDNANMDICIKQVNFNNWPFQKITLTFNPSIYSFRIKKSKANKNILIGYIPNGINSEPRPYEPRSLDVASTSEALIVKIINIIRDGKLFKINKKDKTKIILTPLKYLPQTKNEIDLWFNNNFLNTRLNSPYIKLINELENYN